MGLFTIDRTINFSEEKVKKVLEIIKTSANVDEIEDKMVLQKIVNLQEGTSCHGFFTRRWVTFLKDFEVYDGQKLTELGQLYINGDLSTKELLFLLLMRRVVKINGKYLRPFEQIVLVSQKLQVLGQNQSITKDEFEKIVALIGIQDVWDFNFVTDLIIENRQGHGISVDAHPGPAHFDIWKNLMIAAGLAEESNDIRIDFSNLTLEAILTYFKDVEPKEEQLGIFNDSFVKYINIGVNIRNENNILMNDSLMRYQGIFKSKLKYFDLKWETKTDKNNLKELFITWLSKRITKKGSPWGEGSIKNCIRLLEKGFAKFDGYEEYTSVFEITTSEEFKGYQQYLQAKEGVAEFDNSENRWFLKGVEEYENFLEDYKKPQMIKIDVINYKTQCVDESTDSNGDKIKLARNRIFFGAPGTGKSYELNEQTKKFIGGDNTYYERVTFHPEYTHSGFFGTYKPVPNPRDVDKITYAFIPGPFLRVLSKALINANREGEKKPYVLLIEEINRANVASVFGEVFQLLDREDDGENAEFLNASKYSISPSEDVKKYLVDEFKKAGLDTTTEAFSDMRIPDNMFIWASMNSADQGVFPMDTAFKRRWEFEYFGINQNEKEISKYYFKINNSGENIYWNVLRKAINHRLTSLKINEDKLMGPFFLGLKILESCRFKHSTIVKAIQNKVVMYLFEDAARQKRKDVFVNGYEKTYSEICKDFETKGINIFAQEIVDKYNELKATITQE